MKPLNYLKNYASRLPYCFVGRTIEVHSNKERKFLNCGDARLASKNEVLIVVEGEQWKSRIQGFFQVLKDTKSQNFK